IPQRTPTPTPSVEYAAHGRVAEVVLNRPQVSNAMDLTVARDLAGAIQRADADPDVDVVLLRGRGDRFCGGGDLAAMAAAPDRSAFAAELAGAAHEAVRAIHGLRKPVVAAVQGAAAGIGFSLVLGADIVVAGESARFVTAYTSVGLTPDGGLSWLLPRAVGQRRATELILTSEPVATARALDLGIVTEVCPDADLLARAREHAVALAARPIRALGESRRLVRASWGRGLDEHLDDEAATISRAMGDDATAALISRFVGRR
ncbi:enoyl-CoA hydratase/isomerase family protein, partial [Parafrankia sp. FMc2]|uniref:enoyl-CoA hydratase/isomerase family protein n=1 Tax=Parafrankia sp. FMc2 TaxID=3233196 RepID=UPI0034D48115